MYVVATDQPPADLDAAALAAAGRLPEQVRGAAERMLAGPLLSVVGGPAADGPPLPLDFLAVYGASEAQIDAVRTAGHMVACRAFFRPGWPPAHEWNARGVAAELARSTGGTLVDLATPRVLDPADAIATLPDADGRTALVQWVLVPQSAGDRGLWMTTTGLSRFGLVELQVVDVPPTLAGPWTAVLSGIASVLLREWTRMIDEAGGDGAPAFVNVPAELMVTTDDIARAYGQQAAEEIAGARVRLRLDPGDPTGVETLLTVVPPNDFGASAGEFYVAVCAELFGSSATTIKRSPSSDEMAAAVETARAELPSARARFVDGAIAAPRHLIVKHELTDGHGSEYVWSSVTEWTDPDLAYGVSMSDAEIDPGVRVGRPTRVPTETIIDWGVWVDGQGIIEGGWTNRLLQEED